jgi:hypothetical protein
MKKNRQTYVLCDSLVTSLGGQPARDLHCKGGRCTVLFDQTLPGFGLRIMRKTGFLSWVVEHRTGSKREQVSLCPAGEMSASAARVRAEELIDERKEETKVSIAPTATLREVFNSYVIANHLRSTTVKGMRQTLEIYGGKLMDMQVRRISHALALETLTAAWARSSTQGNLFLGYCKSLFTYAELSHRNPFKKIRKITLDPKPAWGYTRRWYG